MQSTLAAFGASAPPTCPDGIQEVSPEVLGAIVDAWLQGTEIVHGLYLARGGSKWIACDNRYDGFIDGCYVEEFDDRRFAVSWLKDEIEVRSERWRRLNIADPIGTA